MFAVTGGKGGCGKTTTALGLARALARRGFAPLVLDADVDMPDLHVLADVPAEPNANALAGGAHLECVAHRPETMPDVRLIPAGDRDRMDEALRAATRWRGPVVVDSPAGAGEDATAPLRHADGSVLVSTSTPQSLSDAAKAGAVAERLDAPVRGTLLRGPGADGVAPPVECSRVERLDIDPDGRVLEDLRFRRAVSELSQVIATAD